MLRGFASIGLTELRNENAELIAQLSIDSPRYLEAVCKANGESVNVNISTFKVKEVSSVLKVCC